MDQQEVPAWGDPGVTYRPIPHRPRYYAGDDGSIWSHCGRVPRRRKPYALPNRRLYISFGDGKLEQVPRLILVAFVGPCPEGLECCHNNGDCQDNRPVNLRWDTPEANARDIHTHGSMDVVRGERNHNARITADTAREVARMVATGVGATAIATALGVSRNQVRAIAKGWTWSHATGVPKQPPLRFKKKVAKS